MTLVHKSPICDKYAYLPVVPFSLRLVQLVLHICLGLLCALQLESHLFLKLAATELKLSQLGLGFRQRLACFFVFRLPVLWGIE